MKKLTRLLVIAAFSLIPLSANAGIIGNANLTLDYSAPTGYVTFPSPTGYGNYYLDYDVKLNGATAWSEAFCVENAPGATDYMAHPYTLLKIDSGLSAYGLTASKYLAAAWVAQYYFANYEGESGEEDWKAGAQIAIWEIMFDSAFNLNSGNFMANNPYTSKANTILSLIPSSVPTSGTEWALAVSPTINEGESVKVADFQNYLVRYQTVPEPASLLLLGLGLLGLAGIRRKMK